MQHILIFIEAKICREDMAYFEIEVEIQNRVS